jgi:hypothetical protein
MLIHTCHDNAALCRGLEKSLSQRHGRNMARTRYDMCESNTAAPCKSSGKGNLNPQGHCMTMERHGRGMGTAWYCKLAFNSLRCWFRKEGKPRNHSRQWMSPLTSDEHSHNAGQWPRFPGLPTIQVLSTVRHGAKSWRSMNPPPLAWNKK